MSAHDWPDFEKHPNPCRTDNGNGEIYAIRLSREAYNYAKVRIDACAGLDTDDLIHSEGAATESLLNSVKYYKQQRDALQQRCEELVAAARFGVRELSAYGQEAVDVVVRNLEKAIKQVQPCNTPTK